MPAFYLPDRHEPLRGAPWSEAAAHRAIAGIVASTVAAFDPATLWPTHPRDAAETGEASLPDASIYSGAAGVIWALLRLQRDGVIGAGDVPIDLQPTIARLFKHSQRFNAAAKIEAPSYFLGDSGPLLLQWKELRDPGAAAALFALCEGNLHNPAREALWGSPGTMVAMLHMIEDLEGSPQQAAWVDLFRRAAQIVFDEMHVAFHSAHPGRKAWLWTQDMYGRKTDHMGAGHGFAGNVYPILRGARWLDDSLVAAYESRALETLSIAAGHEGGIAYWQPFFDTGTENRPPKPLMQDCHGAPGMVCRLMGTRSEPLRSLLGRGAEGAWRAGPLKKPPGLCHGTDGNGYAFLKMHAATGDAMWLNRARAFAMHAIEQAAAETAVHGRMRFTLWSGDVGLAVYLSSCLRADAALPVLDVF